MAKFKTNQKVSQNSVFSLRYIGKLSVTI